SPDLSGPQELVLPDRGGAELGVEGGEEVTGHAAEVRAIGYETQGDELGMRPGVAGHRIQDHARLQFLDPETYVRGQGQTRRAHTSARVPERHGCLLRNRGPSSANGEALPRRLAGLDPRTTNSRSTGWHRPLPDKCGTDPLR